MLDYKRLSASDSTDFRIQQGALPRNVTPVSLAIFPPPKLNMLTSVSQFGRIKPLMFTMIPIIGNVQFTSECYIRFGEKAYGFNLGVNRR